MAQGVVQHGLIDPIRGDASDPFANVGADTLFGLGGSLTHAGKDALSTRWSAPGSARPGSASEPDAQFQSANPGTPPEPHAAAPQSAGAGSLGSLDPRTAAMVAMNGTALIQRGLHDFSDWSRIMLNQHGEAIRPRLAELWSTSTALGMMPALWEKQGTAPLDRPSPGRSAQPRVHTSAAPENETAYHSTDKTPPISGAKKELKERGFPSNEVDEFIKTYYVPSNYQPLSGANTVWLVSPSTSGKNTIPSKLAERLAADHGGQVVEDALKTVHEEEAKNRRGFLAKMENPSRVKLVDPQLADKLKGKRVVVVDDILTSGDTADAITETLANHGVTVDSIATLGAVKGGRTTNPGQLKDLATRLSRATNIPIRDVLNDVTTALGKAREKFVTDGMLAADQNPTKTYELIRRKAEAVRATLPGGR